MPRHVLVKAIKPCSFCRGARMSKTLLGTSLTGGYNLTPTPDCNRVELIHQKIEGTAVPIRVDMVGTNHDKVLTLCRHMPMGQFRANIFLIRLTSTYFWASEVFRN